MPADTAKRGCGDTRVAGGVYLESALGPGGRPIEDFLLDPPIVPSREQLDAIPRVGVQIQHTPRGTGVLDWIGESGYPYATDFIEEVRRMGLSRKVSARLDFTALEHGAKIYCLHPRAALANWRHYHEAQGGPELDKLCPRRREGIHYGADVDEHCIRHLWAATPRDLDIDEDDAVRSFVGQPYRVYPPAMLLTPAFVPAIFAAFPITNITVVRAEGGRHRDTLARVRDAAHLPVLEGDR